MENIMLCQAEYDLAVTVGSQGSAAACKERQTVFFFKNKSASSEVKLSTTVFSFSFSDTIYTQTIIHNNNENEFFLSHYCSLLAMSIS